MKLSNNEFKIKYYKRNGKLENITDLTKENLRNINGMMTKCSLKNGSIVIGYADPLRTHDDNYDDAVHDYINLCTWDNLDENTHKLVGNVENKYNQTFIKVNIDDIKLVEVILYSNPRWGGKLTNKFEFDKYENDSNEENDEVFIPPFLKDRNNFKEDLNDEKW